MIILFVIRFILQRMTALTQLSWFGRIQHCFPVKSNELIYSWFIYCMNLFFAFRWKDSLWENSSSFSSIIWTLTLLFFTLWFERIFSMFTLIGKTLSINIEVSPELVAVRRPRKTRSKASRSKIFRKFHWHTRRNLRNWKKLSQLYYQLN